ncbi:MAG TPA: carboxymuconolactone decarboxylase family protein [Acidimicrobiales bacterium]|nr:carboxymuconolactone decarboxylase family protein [Acidimicrobiales bacterium]
MSAIFTQKEEETGRVPALYRALANAPRLLQAWTDLALPLRYEVSAPRALRELMILRIAHLRRSRHEAEAHRRFAIEAGVPMAKIDAVADWRASEAFDEPERACLELVDTMTLSTRVPDGSYAGVRRLFTPAEQVELVLTVAFYHCVSSTLAALDL